ncbi:MAG: 2,4-dihydroxyhept-2-ene-1,7-dioic acid aldolase [Lachnospiraceae bacterium]|nr:2,4-dihydroxyhept-2-ene-1,7-dioic acid aldolase [Lachnospiraceae bacterium]MBQ9593859.1 2,4-dihydroxyhept-2-ene-1,7-dioic acid aldolase [Lachnospiraceae bacterium]MBR0152762.1 2,4-dihydroxyhept-2-ene-1,7-dioic acid aldolase [Lachnospiraceae bacterium]
MTNLKEKLYGGEKIYGTMLRVVRNPAIIPMAKEAGFDFVMLDTEYSNYTIETVHDLAQMARAVDLGCFFRATMLSKAVSRYLDAGTTGVMVPMTETKEMAEEIVHWSKYPPLGDRGFAGVGAITGYMAGLPHAKAMEAGNANVLSIAQIETRKAIENVEEIAQVEGIDVLLIGPNDLSISLGIPGDTMNPLMIEAITKTSDACRKYGKKFAIHGGPKMLERFSDRLDMMMMQNDIDVLRTGLKGISEKIHQF